MGGEVIETTLAGNWTTSTIRAALEQSFFTRLFYICLDNPERSIQRVRERVAQGGHDVPDADVRRRYTRSLSNARHVLQIVQQALVFDNSGAEPRPVFQMRHGQLFDTAHETPTSRLATHFSDRRFQPALAREWTVAWWVIH